MSEGGALRAGSCTRDGSPLPYPCSPRGMPRTSACWCRRWSGRPVPSIRVQRIPVPCARDALDGEGLQRRPQRLRQAVGEVAKAVGGGYCRLQMPLRLALGVWGTQAGRPRGGGGGTSPPSNASLPCASCARASRARVGCHVMGTRCCGVYVRWQPRGAAARDGG